MLKHLALSAAAYPQKIDLTQQLILLVEQHEAAYKAASFLDDRILRPGTKGAWTSIASIDAASRSARSQFPLHFIFHTGHVGSTLLSRVIDETAHSLPVREPLPLRTLAEAQDALGAPNSVLSAVQLDALLTLFVRLWTRGFDSTRAVVLKATSATARLAPRLLGISTNSRAIYLNVRAEPYLATLLAGSNSMTDLKGHGPERIQRLAKQLNIPLVPLASLSPGELTAMSWLAESLTQHEVLAAFPDRVLGVDFDTFLTNAAVGLQKVLEHLRLDHDEHAVRSIAHSSVMARYSKAPEHDYTPAIRAELLQESRSMNSEEIRRGMMWLEHLGRRHPRVAHLL